MAIDCTDPQAIIDGAQKYCCIPKGIENQAIIALLMEIAGVDWTAAELIAKANEYCCIPKGLQQESILALLCQIANSE